MKVNIILYGPMNKDKFNKYKTYFGNMTAVVKVVEPNEDNKKAIQEKNLVDNITVKGVNKNYRNTAEIVKEQMKKCNFAIIRMPSIIGAFACREARKQNIPYLIEMVGCPQEALWYHGGIKFKIAMPFLVYINKRELRKSKYTIYVTEKFLQKRYPTKGKYISCSDVVIKEISSEVLQKRKNKIKENKCNETFKLGLIGSLNVDYKGHETAIKAISELKEKMNLELHFLGAGNKERWVELAKKYKVENNVFFDGVLPHEKVNDWIDDIDIYLIPSSTEGMPRALIEAMSRGCPAIGSNVGGIPELINEEYIIKKKNHKQLADKIFELCSDQEKMEEIARKNFDKSLDFKNDKLEHRVNDFYMQFFKYWKNDSK